MDDSNACFNFSLLTPVWASRCALFDLQNFGAAAWSEAIWKHELARQDCTYLALIAPPAPHQSLGQLLALGGVGHGVEAEILTIAVDSHYRRQGIAKALLTQLIQRAGSAGSEEIFLEVRAADEGAQRLYCAFDFAKVGVRKNYYPDGDAILMRKSLLP